MLMNKAGADREIEGQPRRQIKVIAPGPQSLVQDGGRPGFQKLGVSVSGAADIDALNVGNRLVGNDPDAAAIEILLGGAEYVFGQAAIFALTGAETGATLDGVPLATNISYSAHAAARLVLGMAGPGNGLRAYLAVAGGIDTPPVLGSRSTHIASEIGGVDGRALAAGDVLDIGEPTDTAASGNMFNPPVSPSASQDDIELPTVNVRVVLGPQDDEFSGAGIRTFLDSTYVVSDQSNRQGLRLDGPEIESRTGRYDIVSDAVVNGSVQVPGDGKPIVLLADRQTTGGYTKVATVASVDLPKLGQAAPGTSITFAAISVDESQELLVARSKHVLNSELGQLVEPISVRVNDQNISIGVAEYETSAIEQINQIAQVNGVAFPILVERYTPVE
jgi:biotin-dependent carboxylase-like uncharacterized protein